MSGEQGRGNLYVVATPIGNLEDLSPRAARILKAVDAIAAEDTRAAGVLLHHVGITESHLISFHEHNEKARVPELIDILLGGNDVALISEAGTPGISDPGFRLVRQARKRGLTILAVPGPSAALAALSVSGLPVERFAFLGFPPRGDAAADWLGEYLSLDLTLVLYEGRSRIIRLLKLLREVADDRLIAVSRELTKMYEDTQVGLAQELLGWFDGNPESLRGEFTVLIAPAGYRLEGEASDESAVLAEGDVPDRDDLLMSQIQLLVDGGYRPSEAVATVARGHRLTKSDLYRTFEAWREK
ncbi:MAG: 16S rRNA (cytidine(1402)-2'-O)-methyltransferase [Clostridia bacterium]